MQSKKLSNLFELNSIKAELQYRSKVSYHCLVRPVSFLSRLVLFFICNLFRSFENVQICCHFGPPFAPVFPWFGIMGCDVSFAFALGISGTSLPHEYRIFRFLKIHKKIDFYPNQKIFCQKFIAWNIGSVRKKNWTDNAIFVFYLNIFAIVRPKSTYM